LTVLGVVSVAVEQELVYGRADPALPGLDQRQAQRARIVLHAEQVTRNLAFRGEDEQDGRVGVLVPVLEIAVSKADGVGEHIDRPGVTGQEVPALGGLGDSVGPQIVLLLFTGELGALAGIDAHRDDLELIAGDPIHLFEHTDHAVEHERAQHRTLVVDEREQHGALGVEVVGQRDPLSRVVGEFQLQRDLGVQVLGHPDLFEILGKRLGELGSAGQRRQGGQQRYYDAALTLHGCISARASSTRRSIARSIGIAAIPSCWLIQR
jgi:hypothetical protein